MLPFFFLCVCVCGQDNHESHLAFLPQIKHLCTINSFVRSEVSVAGFKFTPINGDRMKCHVAYVAFGDPKVCSWVAYMFFINIGRMEQERD